MQLFSTRLSIKNSAVKMFAFDGGSILFSHFDSVARMAEFAEIADLKSV